MKQQKLHKILNHYIYILLCIIIITITSGCSTPFLSDNNSNNTKNNNAQTSTIDYALADNEAFNNYTNDLFCNSVTSDTVTLHSLLEHPKDYGIDDYEVTLGSIDLEELDSVNDITEALNELLTFDRSSLSQSQQVTYDELKRYLETQLEYSDLYLFNTQLSTTIGIQVQLPLIFAEYSFEEEKDVTEYITLMCDTDRFFQNIVDYETLRSKSGYFMQDELANEIITQCQTFVQSADSGFLITTFDERLDTLNNISDEQKEEYKKQNLSAIQEHLVKGYNILIDGLNSLLGSNTYKGGLKNYPNGDKYFEYLLKYNLGWSKSVEELNALADKYLKKNLIAMQKLLVNEPTLSTAFESFSFSISNPADIISDLKNKIKEDFPDAPDVDCTINYISDSLKDYASPAMYFTPQLDNISVNSIYINPSESDSNTLYATMAHEGYPGHMYQMTYFTASNPNPIRFILQPNGFVEGWATYCELHSYSYANTGNDKLNSLAAANYATILCLYAKMDIGINYYGWDESNTASFLSDYGFDSTVAKTIFNSIVSEPANYCKYVLGYIGFSELKETAQSRLGDKFNLKEFHKFIMDLGPVTFDTLNERLDQWIANY
jgi:uncharacterized protein (DUF885 family)